MRRAPCDARARDVALEPVKILLENPVTLRDDRPIQIFAQEFGDSSINFEVTWWTGSRPVDVRRSRDQVVASVKRILDEAGLEIPFPYRTRTFKEPLSLQGGAGASEGEMHPPRDRTPEIRLRS